MAIKQKNIPFYQIDAFTDDRHGHVFSGNPAAVCPLDSWLPDPLMQAIAAENNLSETAFFVPTGNSYHIRWFTPVAEVDLCGHATLAAAKVLFDELGYKKSTVVFSCRSGTLEVSRNHAGDLILDLPVQPPEPVDEPDLLAQALGLVPVRCLAAVDLLVEVESEAQVAALTPDFRLLKQVPYRGVIVTAPGDRCDIVCRFFAPAVGVDEDPVTGSAYTQLVPFWAERLGQTGLTARQLSARGGALSCQLKGARVLLQGQARLVIRGEMLPG